MIIFKRLTLAELAVKTELTPTETRRFMKLYKNLNKSRMFWDSSKLGTYTKNK